jgi:branched-chain amino acid aminotransferase
MELVEIHEVPLPLEALAQADEAFLTSSTRDVQAISAVDQRKLRCAGPAHDRGGRRLRAELLDRDLDP